MCVCFIPVSWSHSSSTVVSYIECTVCCVCSDDATKHDKRVLNSVNIFCLEQCVRRESKFFVIIYLEEEEEEAEAETSK